MSKIEWGPKTSIIGNIEINPSGQFYWVLQIGVEGLDQRLEINSLKSGTFFSSRDEAKKAMEIAGHDIADKISDVVRPKDGFVEIIDRNKEV